MRGANVVLLILFPFTIFGLDELPNIRDVYGTYKLSFYCLTHTEEMVPTTSPTELYQSVSELASIFIRPNRLEIGTRISVENPEYYFSRLNSEGISVDDDSMRGLRTVTFYQNLYGQRFPYKVELNVLLQVQNQNLNIQLLNANTIAIPVNEYIYFYTRS